MLMKPEFELVEIAGEHMAVPVGDEAASFQGVVALSDAAYFVLKNMQTHQTEDDLIYLLTQEYDVSESVAREDLKKLVETLLDMGLIET